MNKNLLAIIFAIFLMLGIACVCAVELQSTSGYGGNNHNYYLADLSYIPDIDIIEIDIPDIFTLPSAAYDGFDIDLPEIPYFPNPVVYH